MYIKLLHAGVALTTAKLVSLLDELISLRTLVLERYSELLHDVSWSCLVCAQNT